MITLLGGRYGGKYLQREPLPAGSTIVIAGSRYTMNNDGTASADYPFGKWAGSDIVGT